MKFVKEGRAWIRKRKIGDVIEKLLVDLPSEIYNRYRTFLAEIVSPRGTFKRTGVVWKGKTAEVYVPADIAETLKGGKVKAEIIAEKQLRIRFEVV